jgi:hypothetical protein
MALLLALVAGLLVVVESQTSDEAGSSNQQGFLSQLSRTSLGHYDKLIAPGRLVEHGPGTDSSQYLTDRPLMTLPDKTASSGRNDLNVQVPEQAPKFENPMRFRPAKEESLIHTKDFDMPQFDVPKIADKEEDKAVQKMLKNENNRPMTLSAIGVGLLTLVTMLGVGIRKALQPATNMAPGSGDNIMEMKRGAKRNSIRRSLPPAAIAERREVLSFGAAAAATLLPQAAHATGKATQKTNFLRYGPRIQTLGKYFDELESAISSADWAAVVAACAADVKKKGKVGPIYAGESAMELWASTYSETKKSVKTENMLAEAEIIGKARESLGGVACKGTGECLKPEGGLFGIGGKVPPKPSDRDLAVACLGEVKQMRKAFNRYVAANNYGLPLELNPLVAIKE